MRHAQVIEGLATIRSSFPAAQTLGIDLPLRMLVWEDEQGAVWLSYNQPAWLAKRHALGTQGQEIVDTMAAALAALARSVAEG